MNKGIIFFSGLLTGAAAGGVGTYFFLKNYFEKRAEEEIESYAEYVEMKLSHADRYTRTQDDDSENDDNNEDMDERNELDNNEGVKRYHHMDESVSSLMERKPFGKEEEEKKGKEMTKYNIDEIDCDEYLKEYVDPDKGTYDKVTLDLIFDGVTEDDQWNDKLFWGYGTDSEVLAIPDRYPDIDDIEAIVGEPYRWCIDYVDPDEKVGAFYVRNHELHQDIEVLVHDTRL